LPAQVQRAALFMKPDPKGNFFLHVFISEFVAR
jgi:hypothetical protein